MKFFLIVLLSIAFTQLNAQVNMSQGLQLYLPFNGNANDASGNGNNGTVNGATLTADQNNVANSAYYFDGINDNISIPNAASLNPLDVMTVCVKVKMQGFYNGFCYNNVILSKGSDLGTSINSHYSIRTSQTLTNDCNFQDTTNHNYRFDFNGNGNATGPAINAVANNSPHVALNNWDCIIGVFDGDSSRIYVNGMLRYSLNVNTKTVNNEELTIGYSSFSSQYPFWFNGIIDEVRIYNRVLNIDERNYYCSEEGSFPQNVNDYKTNMIIEILPNPSTNEVFINTTEDISKAQIRIMNMSGQIVNNKKPNLQNRIDISSLQNGMYILEILTDKKIARQKFFKN